MKLIDLMNSKIMKDMHELMHFSDNPCVFLESEQFEDGTYTKEDFMAFINDLDGLLELVKDNEKLKEEVECTIEMNILPEEFGDENNDLYVSFLGNFLDLMNRDVSTVLEMQLEEGTEDFENEGYER